MTTAGTPQRDHWKLRHKLRYGSRLEKTFPTRMDAELFANAEIQGTGGVGRIYHVSLQTKTIYYDTYPDDDY